MLLKLGLLIPTSVFKRKVVFAVDTPDPQFQIICEKLQSAHVQKFKTRSIPDNVTEGDVDEEFSFVVPEYIEKTGETFPITVSYTVKSCLILFFIKNKTF